MVEVRFARVARPVPDKVVRVTLVSSEAPVIDKAVPVIFPALMFANEASSVEVIVDTVVVPLLKLPKLLKPLTERAERVVVPAETPPKVESPATPKVPLEVKEETVEAPLSKLPNLPNPPNERLAAVIFVEVKFAS